MKLIRFAAVLHVERVLSCASSGCRLVLHAGTSSYPAWFEHDQQIAPRHVLMNCAHLDPEVKAEVRHNRLRRLIGGLDTPVMSLAWYCVWCGDHYQGMKHCPRCLTGIYSIEEANWQTLLLQYRIVLPRLYEPDTAVEAVPSLI